MVTSATYRLIIAVAFSLTAVLGCSGKPVSDNSVAHPGEKTHVYTSKAKADGGNTLKDEKQFRAFYKDFQNAVKQNNKTQLSRFFYFPLQTSPQWTGEDLKNTSFDPKEGLINQQEFLSFYSDIFSKDARRLIPASKEDDLSEIDKTTAENYYITLQQVTDKGSTLYELQKQYTEDTGKETSFGFVFGKVNGNYKAVSYYRPWPLK